ncbi:SapC family protein [Ideonella sp.]|uniref:SapC family protein n=1 Tax=Ideonella sp. TaxID=1929293 RepID=UPI0035B29684
MINPELHKKPVALDRVAHRNLKIRREMSALDATAGLNAFFITAAEFADACKEYPILFLRAGKDEQGKDLCAPVTVFGLLKGENLVYRHGRWNARYVPALLRSYPFAMAPTPDKQFVVCFDETSPVFSQTEGQALFDEKGEPTPYLEEVRQFVEKIEIEVDRTRLAGRKMMEMNLLQDKRFDATLPDGTPLSIDGFMAVDEDRLKNLSDAEVLELQRTGLLALLHFHMASMSNISRLLEIHVEKRAGEKQ